MSPFNPEISSSAILKTSLLPATTNPTPQCSLQKKKYIERSSEAQASEFPFYLARTSFDFSPCIALAAAPAVVALSFSYFLDFSSTPVGAARFDRGVSHLALCLVIKLGTRAEGNNFSPHKCALRCADPAAQLLATRDLEPCGFFYLAQQQQPRKVFHKKFNSSRERGERFFFRQHLVVVLRAGELRFSLLALVIVAQNIERGGGKLYFGPCF